MSYLFASFVLVNLYHGWLVLDQRDVSPASLSYHSVKNRFTLGGYMLVHLLAGILLTLFIYSEFGFGYLGLTLIGVVAVVSEWLQALLPAKGRTDKLHTVFAGLMSISLIILVMVAGSLSQAPEVLKIINLALCSLLLGACVFVRYPPKKGFWKLQFFGQSMLYVQMFILLKF